MGVLGFNGWGFRVKVFRAQGLRGLQGFRRFRIAGPEGLTSEVVLCRNPPLGRGVGDRGPEPPKL